MPSTIVHSYIGVDTLNILNEKPKKIIQDRINNYKIYCQNMDVLYFYHILLLIDNKIQKLGYKFHNENECVGYILTFNDNTKVYVLGDTGITPQMDEIGSLNIDYAFIPCDGKYTMSIKEAVLASEKINSKHNIPYHMESDGSGFDENVALSFNAKNRLIIKPLEEIIL